MTSKTNEQSIESSIEKHLSGTCLEELKEQNLTVTTANESTQAYRKGLGYYLGEAADFNAKYALDEVRFWDFLQTTQKEELSKLQMQSDWKFKVVELLNSATRGNIKVS